MKIRINKIEKVALIKALSTGILDTSKIPALQEVLDKVRPDMKYPQMTDEELDNAIKEMQKKLAQ